MPEWARFQNWVSKQLYKCGLKTKVNSQSGGGLGRPDVAADPFAIECKSYATLSSKTIIEAVRQAQRDCTQCDKYPIAICRDEAGNIIVAMDFKEFKNIVMEFVVKEDS